LNESRLHVAVGIIKNTDDLILITRRAKKVMQGDKWEFPGGKVEKGETVFDALCRELKEEVAIDVIDASPLVQIPYEYKEGAVLLDVWQVTAFQGEPFPAEGQPMTWVSLSDISRYTFPKANEKIIQYLRSPF